MSSLVRYTREKIRRLMPAVLVVVVASACELDVADPSVIQTEELAGPSAIPTQLTGVIGDLATATESNVLYTGMFTDEFILAGTFPTRVEVDERRVNFSNATIEGEVDEDLHVARQQADNMVADFQGFLGNEDFPQATLRDGIAIGQFVGGLTRLWLGELFCTPVIETAGSPVSSEQAASEALALFESAETSAMDADLPEWADAARLGQARALLWLGQHDQAAAVASNVSRGHRLFVEFSNNDPEQFNKVFDITFGSQNESIRWTVGDGNQPERFNEKFGPYDEFVALGIIDPDPDQDRFEAFNSTIVTHLQLVYDEAPDDILLSNGLHARLIEAEAMIRNGQTQMAEDVINDVRADFRERWTAERFRIEAEAEPIALTGDMEADLLVLAGEIARETWLAGTRQATLRRFVREFGDDSDMDLYPDKPGDDECFPVTEQEETGAVP